MTTEEKLDRLTNIVDALASTVVGHDNQMDTLIKTSERNWAEFDQLIREWQAYLRTIRPQ